MSKGDEKRGAEISKSWSTNSSQGKKAREGGTVMVVTSELYIYLE